MTEPTITADPRRCPAEFAGARLVLCAERAIWWPDASAVLVADVHLGKPASFRAGGAPVPETVTTSDLDRLSALLDDHAARRLVILGDLAHDAAAWGPATMASVGAWRDRHADVEMILVRGNHDERAGAPPDELRIAAVDPGWSLGGIEMHHDPATVGAGPALCGHVHPAVRLRAAGPGRGLRVPCFWFTPTRGMLPAFGAFTGCAVVRPRVEDRVYVIGADRVVSAPMPRP